VTGERQALLAQLGFRFGINGPHAARTMMLDDLRVLFAHTPPHATREDFARAVVVENVLGKPTKKARELAMHHLVPLYGLTSENPIFRVLRRLWDANVSAQPLLALSVALARDPLLRGTRNFYLSKHPGESVSRESVEGVLAASHPDRFSPASLRSFAQNVSGTWTSAGFLHGRSRKTRGVPEIYPESVTMLLFLGYLEGRTGQRLFSSDWTSLTGLPQDELEAHTNSASHRGLLVFMNAGGVKEVRFPGYLTPDEERIRQEVSHVV
jgi:hypothetical protein